MQEVQVFADGNPGCFDEDVTQVPVAERTHFAAALFVSGIIGSRHQSDITAEIFKGLEAPHIHDFGMKRNGGDKPEAGERT